MIFDDLMASQEYLFLLTLFDITCLKHQSLGRGGGGGGSRWGIIRAHHHNFVVIVLMIVKFGTGMKLDVFYTVIAKEFMTSLLLRNYDVITCILADT